MATYTTGRCPVCNSTSSRLVGNVDLERGRITPPDDSCIVACRDCDLLYTDPMPHWDEADFEILYGDGYFKEPTAGWRTMRAETIPARRLALIRDHLRSSSKTMLELGAGVQAFMSRYMVERDWDVVAQEPSSAFARALRRADPPISVLSTPFLDLPGGGSYSLVYADSVLEHVPSPIDYFVKIVALLEPGGILYFVSPNELALTNRIRTWRQRSSTGVAQELCPYHDSFHLIGYSRRALESVARQTGLELLEFIQKYDCRAARALQESSGVRKYPRAALLHLMDLLGFGVNLEVVLRAPL